MGKKVIDANNNCYNVDYGNDYSNIDRELGKCIYLTYLDTIKLYL